MCAAAHGWLYDWQTLIAGLLALLAGVGTVIAANRQVKAARRQTELMRGIERRRIASEGYAFHAMLEAAMGLVIMEVVAARKDGEAAGKASTAFTALAAEANEARHRIRRRGFAELRAGCLRFGGTLTDPFLSLDEAIDDLDVLAAQLISQPAGTMVEGSAGLREQLRTIEQQAYALWFEAQGEKKRCRDELDKELA
jgi:hypothetical protein